MNAQLVMNKEEIIESQERAKSVKKFGNLGKVPPTSYHLKVREIKKEAQKLLDDNIGNQILSEQKSEIVEGLFSNEELDILMEFITNETNGDIFCTVSEHSIVNTDYE